MASSTAEPDIECPVCLEIFHDPKILPCGHSICAKCIDTMKAGSAVIQCPKCRLEVEVTAKGFASNYDLKNLIAHMQKIKLEKKYVCSECVSERSLEQLCVCDSCKRQVVCYVCAFKNHRNHDTQLMSEFLDKTHKNLDDWREEFMKTAIGSISWEYEQIGAGFQQEGNVGARLERAFFELKHQWYIITKEVKNIAAEQLIIDDSFENFVKEKTAKIESLKIKRDFLLDETRAALDAMKRASWAIDQILSEPKDDATGYTFCKNWRTKFSIADKRDSTWFGCRCYHCHRWISSVRYKCTKCLGCDLCSDCFTTHSSTKHAMIRIASPSDYSWRWFYIWSQTQSVQLTTAMAHQVRALPDEAKRDKMIIEWLQQPESHNRPLNFAEIQKKDLKFCEIFEKSAKKMKIQGRITCDECGVLLSAIVLICITCFDYYLCEKCDQAHKHDHHAMIRAATPDDDSWLMSWFLAETPVETIPKKDSSQ